MTISLSQQSGTTEKLDDLTEKAMMELIQAGLTHGYTTKLAIGDCRICQEALSGARRSVRRLIEEARAEGVRGGTREQGAAP